MQLNILRGPLLLLVWQVAPVEVQPDSNGRYRVSFGYGRGQYEARQLNCAGNVVSARPVGFQASGAQVDAWPTTRIRFSAFGGVLSMDRGRYDGPFGGLLIAAEGQHVGIGAGPVHVSGSDSFTGPSLYLRLGNIDRPHFRFDVLPPSPTFGTTGWGRVGIGFNQGHLRGASGFAGFSITPYSDESHVGGVFGEVLIPAGTRFDLAVRGAWRPSAQYADWGAALGARYSFGR